MLSRSMRWMLLIALMITHLDGQKLGASDCTEKYCYDLDFEKPQRSQYGTKTPYPRYTDFNVNRAFAVASCTPVKLWLVVRHGARFPTTKELKRYRILLTLHDEIVTNYEMYRAQNRCRMCSADYNLIRNWEYRSNLTKLTPNHLLPEGFNEMKRLAENVQKMFPTLFDERYSKQNYVFAFAKEQRTRYSYHGFTEGLFGTKSYQHIKPYSPTKNLLESYSLCKHSIRNSEIVDNFKAERRKFTRIPPFLQMIRDVSLRLGLNYLLSLEHFSVIWEWCRYEQSWQPKRPSPWCASFLPHHFKYLEYWDDLEYYYKKGYGSNVTLKLTCTAVNDMLYHMSDNIATGASSTNSPKVVTYFVHSTFMQLFLTSLGLFRDPDHLRANNFEQMLNRTFKSSRNLPLSSNLAVVKYTCSGGGGENYGKRDKVMFLLNQRPVNVSWCTDSLCDLSEVKRTYAHYVALDCNTSFCDSSFGGFDEMEGIPLSLRVASVVVCMVVLIFAYVCFCKIVKYY